MATDVRSAPTEGYVNFDEYIDFQLGKTKVNLKWTEIGMAFLWVGIAVIGYLLFFAIFDQWVIPGGFGPLPRGIMLAVLAGGTIYAVVAHIVLPGLRRVQALYAAKVIERADPDLKSALLNFVDLRRTGRPIPAGVQRALEKRAAVTLSRFDVDLAVDRRPLLRFSYILLAVIVAFGLYAILSPKDVLTSVKRALLPGSLTPAPTQTTIANLTPGTISLAARSPLTVEADIGGKVPDKVHLIYTTADRKIVDEAVEMRRIEEGLPRFRGTLLGENGRGLLQNLTYHLAAGDSRTPDYQVTVNQPPSARIDQVAYEYPKYMDLPPKNVPGGPIDAWDGTQVTVSATANMPVKSAQLVLLDVEDPHARGEEIPARIADGTRIRVQWKLGFRTDGTAPRFYALRVRTEKGETDPDPTLYSLKIRPDLPPDVSLLSPTGDLTKPANATIPLVLQASDPDFRLRSLRLKATLPGGDKWDTPLFEEKDLGTAFRGKHELALAPLKLKAGDKLQIWIEARDNRQPTANSRSTPKIEVTIAEPVSPEQAQKQLDKDRQKQDEQIAQDPPQNAENQEPPEQPPEENRDPNENAKEQDPPPRAEGQKDDRPNDGTSPPRDDSQTGEDGEAVDKPRDKPSTTGEDDEDVLERLLNEQRKRERENRDKPSPPMPSTDSDPSAPSPKPEGEDNPPPEGEKSTSPRPTNDGPKPDRPAKSEPPKAADPSKTSPSESPDAGPGENPEEQPRPKSPQENTPAGPKPEPAGDKPKPTEPAGDKPKPNAEKTADQKPDGPSPINDPASPMPPEKPGEKAGSPKTEKPADKPKKSESGKPQQPGKPDEKQADRPNGDSPKPGEAKGRDPAAKKPMPGDAPPNDPAETKKGKEPEEKKPEAAPKEGEAGKKPGEPRDEPKPTDSDPAAKPKPDRKPGGEQGMPEDARGEPMPGASDDSKKPGENPAPDENPKSEGGTPTDTETPAGDSRKGQDGRPNTESPKDADDPGRSTEPITGEAEEKPAEDSPDARDVKATGQEEGPAKGAEKPDPDAVRAEKPLDKQPGDKGARKPSKDKEPSKTEPMNSERRPGASDDPDQAQPAKPLKPQVDERPKEDDPPDVSSEHDPANNPDDRPPAKKEGQPDDGNDELKGPGRKDGQKAEQPMGGEAGSSKAAEKGQPGGNKEGPGDKDTKPGEADKADKPTGQSSDKKGQGSKTAPSKTGTPTEGSRPTDDPAGQKPEQASPGEGERGSKGQPSPDGQTGNKPGPERSDGSGMPPGDTDASPQDKDRRSGNHGGGPGDLPAESEPQDPAATDQDEQAAIQRNRDASNLVLRRLKDELKTGHVDAELLKKLGWTEENLKQFVERMEQRINDNGEDNSPESLARRKRFEEFLRSLKVGEKTERRNAGNKSTRRAPNIQSNSTVPPEYRDQFEAFTKSQAKGK